MGDNHTPDSPQKKYDLPKSHLASHTLGLENSFP